jgi:hypothetical protein
MARPLCRNSRVVSHILKFGDLRTHLCDTADILIVKILFDKSLSLIQRFLFNF